jgi:hypothetical protein
METLIDLGFSELDIKILFLCPLFTAIGGLVHVLMVSCDLSRWPAIKPVTELELSSNDWKSKAHEITAFVLKRILSMPAALVHPPYWIFARIALSGLTGLVIGLCIL